MELCKIAEKSRHVNICRIYVSFPAQILWKWRASLAASHLLCVRVRVCAFVCVRVRLLVRVTVLGNWVQACLLPISRVRSCLRVGARPGISALVGF